MPHFVSCRKSATGKEWLGLQIHIHYVHFYFFKILVFVLILIHSNFGNNPWAKSKKNRLIFDLHIRPVTSVASRKLYASLVVYYLLNGITTVSQFRKKFWIIFFCKFWPNFIYLWPWLFTPVLWNYVSIHSLSFPNCIALGNFRQSYGIKMIVWRISHDIWPRLLYSLTCLFLFYLPSKFHCYYPFRPEKKKSLENNVFNYF